MGGPEVVAAHLVFQRVDDLAPGPVEGHELLVGPEQIEGLDLLAHEPVGPVELLLELRLGLEVPCHGASSAGRI